ncbi:hypothetical protein Tco_1076869 [Tanacetum coccineum]
MTYPRFTKIIINHFLSIHKSIPKGPSSSLNTIKDDGVLSRMKFVRIGEDVQKYGKAIPSTMLTNAIKQSEAYKAFIGYSTGLIPPKKTRGQGSKGKQQEVTTKKKTMITIDGNIISDDPDAAFELGKPISKTDAEIVDETRRVHETHARLVTEKAASEEACDKSGGEFDHKVTGRRRTRGVTIRDTPRVSKKKSTDHSRKLKGIKMMTVEEQLAADTMQSLKASKKSSRSQSHTGGSSEGTGVLDEVKGASEAKVDRVINWGSEDENDEQQDDQDDDDDRSIDIEKTDDEEETDDGRVHGVEYVHDDVDEEMKDVGVAETGKDKEDISYAAKADA